MRRFFSLASLGLALVIAGCGSRPTSSPSPRAGAITGPIRIELDPSQPSLSFGVLPRGEDRTIFNVGFGRHGVTCAGGRFEEGYTPLGRFRVNAILTSNRFEMDPALIAQSGKTEAELRRTLFRNMNAIDFNGDGINREYGIGYISLAPIGGVKQPFAFNTYAGTFRWYSFALHGSNNDRRIGQKVTGGCVNLKEPDLKILLGAVKLGDEVVVTAKGPCTP
jgi:L,D-transpeptidase catalytic domain